MMYAALAAFAAAAIAGVFLATRHFLRKRLPISVALLHGLGGATGFTLLLLIVVRDPTFELARRALYLFIATIALGSVNLLFHIRGVRHRTSLIVMHAMAAVSGVSTLLYALFVPAPSPEPTPAPAVPSESAAPQQSGIAQAPEPAPEPPASAAPAAVASAPAEVGTELLTDAVVRSDLAQSVRFATASVAPASAAVLSRVAKTLKAHPEIALLQVQGHADQRGDDARNLELTQARAAAVVDALVALGVARERLHPAGYGARCPADEACRQSSPPPSCQDASRLESDRRVAFVALQVGSRAFRGELVCERGAALIPEEDKRFQASR